MFIRQDLHAPGPSKPMDFTVLMNPGDILVTLSAQAAVVAGVFEKGAADFRVIELDAENLMCFNAG